MGEGNLSGVDFSKGIFLPEKSGYRLYRNNNTSASFRNSLNFLRERLNNFPEHCFQGVQKNNIELKWIKIILQYFFTLFHENKFVTDFTEKTKLADAFWLNNVH